MIKIITFKDPSLPMEDVSITTKDMILPEAGEKISFSDTKIFIVEKRDFELNTKLPEFTQKITLTGKFYNKKQKGA